MRFFIISGASQDGCTAELLKPFTEQLESSGAEVDFIALPDADIKPCTGCRHCQDIEGAYGCVIEDDMSGGEDIAARIIAADCIILATPIYNWFCTAPMKALLDRTYGLNKVDGEASDSLWEGKSCAVIATHEFDRDYSLSLFETAVKRLCKHSGLNYRGIYSCQETDGVASMQTDEAVNGAKNFANALLG